MSEREWRFYLDDMIACAEKVLLYTEGFDQARFEANGLTYDATVRNLFCCRNSWRSRGNWYEPKTET